MAKNDAWIPVREQLPESAEWVLVQTQDGTVYPATYTNNKWVPLFRGGLVEQLMHGKVAYWQPHAVGYAYVQCKCGNFYLQAEGRTECPICASFNLKPVAKAPVKVEEVKEEVLDELPFAESEEDLLETLLLEEEEPVKPRAKKKASQ